MDYVIYHHTSELGPKQFTLEKLPTDLKNININIRYSPEVDSLLDVLYKIKHSDTQVSDMAMEKDSILAIEQTLEHNPKSITNLYNIKETLFIILIMTITLDAIMQKKLNKITYMENC